MFNTQLKQQLAACQQQLAEAQARREAVDRSMAVIEFQPDGTIACSVSPAMPPAPSTSVSGSAWLPANSSANVSCA